jgi:hypothetical protein
MNHWFVFFFSENSSSIVATRKMTMLMDKKSRCPTFRPWQIIQIYGEASPVLPSSPVLRWPGPRSRKLHLSVFWNQKNIKIYKSYWYLNINQYIIYIYYILFYYIITHIKYYIIYISVRISTIFVCKSYIRISTQSPTNTNKYDKYISIVHLWTILSMMCPSIKTANSTILWMVKSNYIRHVPHIPQIFCRWFDGSIPHVHQFSPSVSYICWAKSIHFPQCFICLWAKSPSFPQIFPEIVHYYTILLASSKLT